MRPPTTRALGVLVASAALFVSGCGADDEPSQNASTAAAPASTTATGRSTTTTGKATSKDGRSSSSGGSKSSSSGSGGSTSKSSAGGSTSKSKSTGGSTSKSKTTGGSASKSSGGGSSSSAGSSSGSGSPATEDPQTPTVDVPPAREELGETQTFSGDGDKDLGTVKLRRTVVVRWTVSGGELLLRDGSGKVKIGGGGKSGQTFLASGSYDDVTVTAKGEWKLTMTALGS